MEDDVAFALRAWKKPIGNPVSLHGLVVGGVNLDHELAAIPEIFELNGEAAPDSLPAV
jgi:hypothetical protein